MTRITEGVDPLVRPYLLHGNLTVHVLRAQRATDDVPEAVRLEWLEWLKLDDKRLDKLRERTTIPRDHNGIVACNASRFAVCPEGMEPQAPEPEPELDLDSLLEAELEAMF